VDTPYGVTLALNGVRSRRLNHAISREAIRLEIELALLEDWLAAMSIADWRASFEATPSELLDLIEYTRTRRGSALPDLLERGATTLPVERAANSEGDSIVFARAMPCEPAPARIGFFSDEGELVAIAPPRTHAEVGVVLDTGLDIRARIDGVTLTLELVD
jgi:hypothetical protein